MALAPGTRIGSYELIGLLGAGGMGEVYRATDVNLSRQVAIKLLPDTFANDPDRLARFEREAKTLASLNHSNIAQIYGLEKSNGIRALVMELVEGPTLADRIAEGPIPVDDALPVARQIAEALEAAHEQGIIHRDLKPANIKVRPDGTVKVLDFGLAKALEPMSAADVSATASPTITSPAMMTGIGMLLGTAAYMSPEQARGKAVDRRSDIWAFGCVLYEMLAGARAFEGENISETLAAVLRSDPDWSALPVSTPPVIRRLLERCLAKERSARLDSAAAARLDILDARANASHSHLVANARTPRPRISLIVAASVLATGMLVGSAVWWGLRPDAPLIAKFEMQVPGTQPLTGNRSFAVTPDGTRIVYRMDSQLFVRPLDQLEPTFLLGGTLPGSICISPDDQWVGFGDVNGLKKVRISGGAAVTLAIADSNFRGATWGPDDTIVFATASRESGLQRVSAAGGDVTILTTPDGGRGEGDHLWPHFLPGGRGVLYTITAATDQPAGPIDESDKSQIAVFDLESGAQTVLVRGGTDAQYVPTGHLIYRVGTALHAVAFDLERLQIVGAAVPVVQDVAVGTFGATPVAVSLTGTLVYVRGGAPALPTKHTLVWVDRNGREEPIGAPARPYLYPRLSPDGTRIAVFSNDEEYDVWAWDLVRGTLARLTFDPRIDLTPMWTPDGRHIVFSSTRDGGQFNLFVQPSDGTGKAERLTDSVNQQTPSGITPDGAGVLITELIPGEQRDINLLRLTPTRRVEPLMATRFDERGGIVSPDGRWLAYESNSSGRNEIYVRPFSGGDGQWQVSHATAGGFQPLWSRDGRELFYMAPDGSVMAVEAEASASRWNPGAPRSIVKPGYFAGFYPFLTRQYDVSADRRFLMLKGAADEASAQPLAVVLNWSEELKRLVPTN